MNDEESYYVATLQKGLAEIIFHSTNEKKLRIKFCFADPLNISIVGQYFFFFANQVYHDSIISRLLRYLRRCLLLFSNLL